VEEKLDNLSFMLIGIDEHWNVFGVGCNGCKMIGIW